MAESADPGPASAAPAGPDRPFSQRWRVHNATERTAPRRAPRWTDWLERLALVLLSLVWLFPLFWMLTTSLKTRPQILSRTPVFLFRPTWENYVSLFGEYDFGYYMWNSTVISTSATVLVVLLGAVCAYPLARIRFGAARGLSLWVLSLYMMPAIAVVMPFYLLFYRLRLLDTRLAVTIAYLSFLLPFGVWMLRGFFAEIPRELDEAAHLDGCSHWGVWRHITLPIARSGIAVTAIFVFIFAWNEFLLALMLTERTAKTIPLGLAGLVLPYRIQWGQLSAGAMVALVPLLLGVFVLQRHIVRGMTMGAIK